MIDIDLGHGITALDAARYYKSLCEEQHKILMQMQVKIKETEVQDIVGENNIILTTYTFPEYCVGVKMPYGFSDYELTYRQKDNFDKLLDDYDYKKR